MRGAGGRGSASADRRKTIPAFSRELVDIYQVGRAIELLLELFHALNVPR